MPNMTYSCVGTVMIALHTEAAPSDEEWSGYLQAMASIPDWSAARSIAFTDGGAPNGRQRKQLNELLTSRLRGGPGLAAAVSSSTTVRSVITALSWFNPAVKAFPPDRVADAYRHLRLTASEIAAVQRELKKLRQGFSVPLRCIVE
jgi:hypothetical protein